MLDSLTKLIGGSKVIAVNVAGLLMAVAFIVFLLTIINYIWKRNTGNTEGLKQAGNMLFAAVFALFVMVAVWGLTEFIARNLGVGVGGCTSRPSPIPGEPAISDCSGKTNNDTGISPSGVRTSTTQRPVSPMGGTALGSSTFGNDGGTSNRGLFGGTITNTDVANQQVVGNGTDAVVGKTCAGAFSDIRSSNCGSGYRCEKVNSDDSEGVCRKNG